MCVYLSVCMCMYEEDARERMRENSRNGSRTQEEDKPN